MKTTWKNSKICYIRDVDLEYYDINKRNVKDPPLLKVSGKKISNLAIEDKNFL